MKKLFFRFTDDHAPITIAVVGFGHFGKLITHLFLTHTDANIMVLTSQYALPKNKRLRKAVLKDISRADLIVPCVPISQFESVIKTIAPFLKPGCICMDICSVKVLPAKLMKKYLPAHVQIIASHPMFGPDSFQLNNGTQGLRLMIHNMSARKDVFRQIVSFFQTLGITILIMTPAAHDKFMAWSLGYSYLIGKIGQRLHIKQTPIDTMDFELVRKNIDIVSHDSEQLFLDMQRHNPFAKDMRDKFFDTTQKIFAEINTKNMV